jgi:hypothetical protein
MSWESWGRMMPLMGEVSKDSIPNKDFNVDVRSLIQSTILI